MDHFEMDNLCWIIWRRALKCCINFWEVNVVRHIENSFGWKFYFKVLTVKLWRFAVLNHWQSEKRKYYSKIVNVIKLENGEMKKWDNYEMRDWKIKQQKMENKEIRKLKKCKIKKNRYKSKIKKI